LFPIEKVVEWVSHTAKKTFWTSSLFPQVPISVYHKDVTAIPKSRMKASTLAVFYADFFPRAGKRMVLGWTKLQRPVETERQHVSICLQLTKANQIKAKSALLLMKVTTLFHEVGHANTWNVLQMEI